MNFFGDEFYRLADELAAEMSRLRQRWGEEIGRPRLRVFRFNTFSIPPGATINEVALSLNFGPWRRWDEIDITFPTDGYRARVTVAGDGQPRPPLEDVIREVINRPSWTTWADAGESGNRKGHP